MQEQIFEYLEEIEGIDASRFVFVDEAAANYSLVREYGRAAKGKRAYGRRPHYRGKRVSMIGALGFDGMRCGMFWDVLGCPSFRDICLGLLIPSLNPGDVVVWDNFSVHKRWEYEKKINEVGAFLLFLPPYSPEFSPIEQAWSKIKNIMRKFAATCSDSLWEAFCSGYDAVTNENAQGWFKGCGWYHQLN